MTSDQLIGGALCALVTLICFGLCVMMSLESDAVPTRAARRWRRE